MSEERPKFCPRCGHEAPAHGGYCPECGADIAAEAGVTDRAPSDTESTSENTTTDETTTTRRRALAGVGGLAVLGGTAALLLGDDGSGKPQHQIYGEGWDVERYEGTRSVQIDGSVTIPEGRYAARNLNPSLTVEYTVDFSVQEGDPIDVMLLNDDEYDRYRDRDQDTQYLTALSVTNSTGSRLTGTVGAGQYQLIFDNTAVFGAQPNGEVTVDLTLTASL